jgi:hypothetical protein
MSTVLQLSCVAAGTSRGAGTVQYIAPGENNLVLTTTESSAQINWQAAGVFSNLYCRLSVNASTGAGTFKFRKAGSNGNQSISIGAGVTGEFQDSVNTDSVVAGNPIDYQWTIGSGGSASITLAAACFAATTNTIAVLANASTGAGISSVSATTWTALSSNVAGESSSEANVQYTMRLTGTFQHMQVVISANTRTDTTTFGFRKNTANGNQTISVLTTQTGAFIDNTHTDSVVSGDLVNFFTTTGAGSGTITVIGLTVDLSSTANQSTSICGAQGGTQNINANTTQYWSAQGCIATTTTETNVQCKTNAPYTASRMRIKISVNGVTASSTLTFRKNTANGNQTLSVGSSATGLFEDTTNTDVLVATDEIDYQMVLGATGTNAKWDTLGHSMAFATGDQYLSILGVGG